MTRQHINLAIENFNNGQYEFNQGNHKAFLFNKRWYPIYALVKHAKDLAGENGDLNTNQAVYELALLIPYLRVEYINFNNNIPIAISNDECQSELREILSIATGLVQ